MDLKRPIAQNPYDQLPALPSMTLTSSDIAQGQPMADLHAKDGGDRSPHLAWSDIPQGTRSFVVTCFDPDAPTPSGFWHWVLLGLPADCTELPTGAGSGVGLPAGAFMLRNDYGDSDFGGAAPPPGDHPHRYVFCVYALDVEDYGPGPDASCAAAHFMMLGHQLGRGTLTATYQR